MAKNDSDTNTLNEVFGSSATLAALLFKSLTGKIKEQPKRANYIKQKFPKWKEVCAKKQPSLMTEGLFRSLSTELRYPFWEAIEDAHKRKLLNALKDRKIPLLIPVAGCSSNFRPAPDVVAIASITSWVLSQLKS